MLRHEMRELRTTEGKAREGSTIALASCNHERIRWAPPASIRHALQQSSAAKARLTRREMLNDSTLSPAEDGASPIGAGYWPPRGFPAGTPLLSTYVVRDVTPAE